MISVDVSQSPKVCFGIRFFEIILIIDFRFLNTKKIVDDTVERGCIKDLSSKDRKYCDENKDDKTKCYLCTELICNVNTEFSAPSAGTTVNGSIIVLTISTLMIVAIGK